MQLLENIPKGTRDEIQLNDAIAKLQNIETVQAYRMKRQTFDYDIKLGYFKVVLHYGVDHPKLDENFKAFI